MELRCLKGHTSWVTSLASSPDGIRLASGAESESIRLWDVNAGKEIRRFTRYTDSITSLAFSPDGTRVASSGLWDFAVLLWDTNTGKEIRRFTGHENSVGCVAFSPDGKYVISGSRDRSIRLWDAGTGREVRCFMGHTGWVTSVAFSSDGTQLASGASDTDRSIRLWDVNTGKEMCRFTGHTDFVSSVAFSPDGVYLASGSDDKTVRLWDTSTGSDLRHFTGHTGWVKSVVFSPDGAQLASAARDKTVRLWDVSTGNEIRCLTGHTDSVNSVVFFPDGTQLASGARDKTIRLWDIVEDWWIRPNTTVRREHLKAVSCFGYRTGWHSSDRWIGRINGFKYGKRGHVRKAEATLRAAAPSLFRHIGIGPKGTAVIPVLGSQETSATPNSNNSRLAKAIAEGAGARFVLDCLTKKKHPSLHRSRGGRVKRGEILEMANYRATELSCKNAVIVDDILTTGTTMSTIAEAISKSSPETSIYGFALGRHFSEHYLPEGIHSMEEALEKANAKIPSIFDKIWRDA